MSDNDWKPSQSILDQCEYVVIDRPDYTAYKIQWQNANQIILYAKVINWNFEHYKTDKDEISQMRDYFVNGKEWILSGGNGKTQMIYKRNRSEK